MTVLIIILSVGIAFADSGNVRITNFDVAKRVLRSVYVKHPYTIYCGCEILGKRIDFRKCGYRAQSDSARADKLEIEHIVDAHMIGGGFSEWREGSPKCQKRGRPYKGRKCAQTNAEFRKMEADLWNLWPINGELNQLRSDKQMSELIGPSDYDFGKCGAKIQGRKFMPRDEDKGFVARAYLYMDFAYRSRRLLSEKTMQLMQAWDRKYPPERWECERARQIREIQGNDNPFVSKKCN